MTTPAEKLTWRERRRIRRQLRPTDVKIIQPGDTLVLLYDRPLTLEQAQTIRDRAKVALDGCDAVVFDGISGLALLRKRLP